MKKLRVLDLFSGIGGFSLGLERTGGFKTVAFCEIEPFPRRVLAKHWPEVPCYDDVRTLTAERLAADGIAVDVICGGFPCQDISKAGAKAGISGGKSRLWNEYARLIGELRPAFAIMENVSDLLHRGMGNVLGDLAALGFDAEWHCLGAADVGLPQGRDRIWIVAYPSGGRQQGLEERDREGPRLKFRYDHDGLVMGQRRARSALSHIRRMDDGLRDGTHRLAALGNAVVPQIPELIGHAILASRAAQTLEAAE